jgi:alpha-glucosidase (family GH31 glycosyl hydrolase)
VILRLMPVTREEAGASVELAHSDVAVAIDLDRHELTISRAGKRVLSGLRLGARGGSGGDRFIQLTEGVIPEESAGDPEWPETAQVDERSERAVVLTGRLREGRTFRMSVALAERQRVVVEFDADDAYRLLARWHPHRAERMTGFGARHGEVFEQRGRVVTLGADRRYTGPDCPPDLLAQGGIPQGDYVPVPWLLTSGGAAIWVETFGPGLELDLGDPASISQRAAAGPLRLHVMLDPTPTGALRHYLRLTGFPALLPEWAYGHWKSRDVYEHERDVLDDFDGYAEHRLPLDAIVIDSPWETQYNTWRFNPNQFPDPGGLIRRMRAAGVRTVVWVTPWVNLESAEGQYPRDAESERLHREPASNYADGAIGGHFVRGPDGRPWVGRWWMGTGSPVDFTSASARRWWRNQARSVLQLGVEGIKADDGEGYYLPPESRLADGRTGADAAWAYGDLYRKTMQRVLDEVHPDSGVLFGRSGWSGQQATGITWGGDQASDFWSLRTLVTATLTAAASGFSNWSHDVGGYLGHRLIDRCPRELLARWVQFGCFTPLMQAHGRFPQEAWRYDAELLDVYREYVLLHERLVPYTRAAAATAARCGLPIIRPLCLTDPEDPHGWELADAYSFGPSLWVAPVLTEGERERRTYLPRGDWIDFWTGAPARGAHEALAAAPLELIPLWVRRGAILVTYPAEHVAEGLGDTPASERPLVATLWGEPRGGRSLARLADGTTVAWRDGEWSVSAERNIRFEQRST